MADKHRQMNSLWMWCAWNDNGLGVLPGETMSYADYHSLNELFAMMNKAAFIFVLAYLLSKNCYLLNLTSIVCVSVWPHWGDQEQLAPGLRQGFLTGLLLWGGAEAALRGVWHPWNPQHRDPWWWLPWGSGMYTRPGKPSVSYEHVCSAKVNTGAHYYWKKKCSCDIATVTRDMWSLLLIS